MRILTYITSGVNGKRIRTSSAMVYPGFNPRVLPSHFSRSVFLLFRHVADLDPGAGPLQSDFRAADVLHANAALQGIDLQGHPHTWLSPGIDVDTSGMSARHEPARLRARPTWKRRSIRAVPSHAGDADCGTTRKWTA
jgi:hypothetical protein